jgi:hypothetical protein
MQSNTEVFDEINPVEIPKKDGLTKQPGYKTTTPPLPMISTHQKYQSDTAEISVSTNKKQKIKESFPRMHSGNLQSTTFPYTIRR